MTASHKWARPSECADLSVDPRSSRIIGLGVRPSERDSIPARLLGVLGRSTHAVAPDKATTDMLREAAIVLSPLVGVAFDATEIVARLRDAGFRGLFVTYATVIPDPGLIRRELAAVAPDLEIEIVALGTGPRVVAA